jgi:hypothetical protein
LLQKSRPETVRGFFHAHNPPARSNPLAGFFMPERNPAMPKDNWKPTRLDTSASARKGRDISSDIDRASKDRSATSLKGSAKSRC